MSDLLTPQELLARIPQQEPFRFVDEILSVDTDGIRAAYTWRADADFYRGHFPGNPVTPGVLLIESMAQAAVVAHGIYLVAQEGRDPEKLLTFFTDAQVDFSGTVLPGARSAVARWSSSGRSARTTRSSATRSTCVVMPSFRSRAPRSPSATRPCSSTTNRSTR